MSAVISIIALIISILALIYTAKTYLLKSGANIRGSYSIRSSISCEDKYVSTITLENLKDRAVIIFKVYLNVGHNYYIEIHDFEEEPLILKPFEVFRKEYDPIDFYSVSEKRIFMNDLLDSKKAKRRLVLSTSDGKYIVRSNIKHWDPVYDFFNNHMTAVIHSVRSKYKGKSYGANVLYVVDFKVGNGKEEVVPIYPRDYEIKKFRNFRLTKESLASKEALEEYLHNKVTEGVLNCADVEVHDLEKWRNEMYEMENKKVITATYDNWFKYHIAGRVFTKISDYQLRKKNRTLHNKRS